MSFDPQSYVTISSGRLSRACNLAIVEAQKEQERFEGLKKAKEEWRKSLKGWEWFKFHFLTYTPMPEFYTEEDYWSNYRAAFREETAKKLLRMSSKGNKEVFVCFQDYSWIDRFLE